MVWDFFNASKDCRFCSRGYKNWRQGLGKRNNSSREQVKNVSYHYYHEKSRIIIRVLLLNIYLLICLFQFCEMAGKKRQLSTLNRNAYLKATLFFSAIGKKCFKSFLLQSLSLGGGGRAGPTFWFCIFCTRIWWVLTISLKTGSRLKIKIPNMNKTSKGFCGAHPVGIQTANTTLFSFFY